MAPVKRRKVLAEVSQGKASIFTGYGRSSDGDDEDENLQPLSDIDIFDSPPRRPSSFRQMPSWPSCSEDSAALHLSTTVPSTAAGAPDVPATSSTLTEDAQEERVQEETVNKCGQGDDDIEDAAEECVEEVEKHVANEGAQGDNEMVDIVEEEQICLRMGLKGEILGRGLVTFYGYIGSFRMVVLGSGLATRVDAVVALINTSIDPTKRLSQLSLPKGVRDAIFPYPRDAKVKPALRAQKWKWDFLSRYDAINLVRAYMPEIMQPLSMIFEYARQATHSSTPQAIRNPVNWQCYHCGDASFVQSSGDMPHAEEHRASYHPELDLDVELHTSLLCDICNILFFSKEDSVRHWRRCRTAAVNNSNIGRLEQLKMIAEHDQTSICSSPSPCAMYSHGND